MTHSVTHEIITDLQKRQQRGKPQERNMGLHSDPDLLGSCSTDMMSHLERLMARTYLGAQMEIIGIWLDDEPDLTAEKKANWQRLHDTLSQVRCHQTLLVLFQGVGRRFQIIRIVV